MSEYRDYVDVDEASIYDGAYVNTSRYSLVYTATHEGERYLPFMNRSFISFSFGGKNIEDFNLIATTENNRMNRAGSAEFEDLVDQYNILDGQFYWGTHFKPNTITFKLATDGITQILLDEFLHWFAGGKTRELILAEHPNRAILARITNPPQLTLLPFEEKTKVIIAGFEYNTSTTIYRGEISLSFTMDEPFWYSIINIFGELDNEGIYHDNWTDANGNTINIYDKYKNLDVMKIVLEDNIPTSMMITTSMLLGNNVFANLDESSGGHIAKYSTRVVAGYNREEEISSVSVSGVGLDIPGNLTMYLLTDLLDITAFESNESRYVPEDKTAIIRTINIMKAQYASAITDLTTFINDSSHALSKETQTMIRDFGMIDNHNNLISEYTWESILSDLTIIYNNTPTANDESTIEDFANAIKYLLEPRLELEPHFVLEFVDDDPDALIFNLDTLIGARIAGPHMASNTGVSLIPYNTPSYFYYAGTAYALPELEFSLVPQFNGSGLIFSPSNKYAQDRSGETYNKIIITSLESLEFRFTTPNIYTSYNEAISILQLAANSTGQSWEEIRILIRDNVKHYAVRAWATRIIDFYVKKYNSKTITSVGSILVLMNKFLLNANDEIPSATYIFNIKDGIARGTFTFREMSNTNFTFDDSLNELEQFLSATYSVVTKEEDVGDMVKSKYLIIKDRNHPDATGHITAWEPTNDFTKTYSHKLEHNITNGITHLYVRYKNMYL